MVDADTFSDAVWRGESDRVRAMIAAGANVHVGLSTGGWPPLHQAIEQQWPEIVYILIAAGADVNQEYDGITPLAHAIDIESDSASQDGLPPGEFPTVLTELLLAIGARPDERAVHAATVYRNHKALTLLRNAAGR